MDVELSDEQVALRDTSALFFARECSTGVVRAAEDAGGFAPDLWARLAALGVPDMATATGVFDLSLVARSSGRRLAPAPVVEALVARRLAASCGYDAPDLTTLAIGPLVPYGAVAEQVLAADGPDVVARAGPGERLGDLGGGALARCPGGPSARVGPVAAWEVAVDEWRVLTAAALVGLGQEALRLGVDYARERHQFGAPIGSFQAVQQRLADVATSLAGASLLVDAAARELDGSGARGRELAAMALWAAGDSAQATAAASLHVHGGYGFMLEYDIQLYFRRAKAWSLLGGDARTLARAVAGERRARRSHDEPLDNDGLDNDGQAGGFRSEVRAFVAEHLTDEVVERVLATGTVHDWGLHRSLAARGWLGDGLDAGQQSILYDELGRAGAPLDGWGTSELVAHTLERVGNDWQRREIVPRIMSGEILVCLGYSEPEAGSDVAAAKTRAFRDGDEWVIDGQKMFTTLAQEAAYVLLLTRTNTEVPKHRGLTMFVVPMSSAGVEVAPLATLGGERTNVTFYTGVRVGDEARVGEVDGGWEVMLVALAFERQAPAWADCWRLVRQVEEWAATQPELAGDQVVGERLARAALEVEVGHLLRRQLAAETAKGRLPVVEGSMAKLFCSEALQRMASDLLDLLGPVGLLQRGAPGAPVEGWVEHAHRHAAVTTIYAGTSEIQRSIIAERGLGLPRSR